MLLPTALKDAGISEIAAAGSQKPRLSIRATTVFAGAALSVRVASIPAVLPSPALSPQQHALPISAFAAATAVADGSGVPPDPTDAPQTDGHPPSSAGAPDAESVDGALSAVTVNLQSHHARGQLAGGPALHSKTRDAPYCDTPSEILRALVVARHAAAPA